MNTTETDTMEEYLARAMVLVAELDDPKDRMKAETGLQRAHATLRDSPSGLYQYCEEVELE